MTRRRAGERGQATVELALALPLLVILLLGVVQVGLVVRDQVLVTHAAREAVRAAAVDPDPSASRDAGIRAGALDPDQLEIVVGPRGSPGDRVTVSVAYRGTPRLPLVGEVVERVVLRAEATMRVEQ